MGLVAFIYSGIGGLAIGTAAAALIGITRKSKNPDSSVLGTFFATVWLTVPVSAFLILMVFIAMWS